MFVVSYLGSARLDIGRFDIYDGNFVNYNMVYTKLFNIMRQMMAYIYTVIPF